MPFQILMNLIISFMWMLLNESYTIPTFIWGFLVGILLLFLFQKFIPGHFYLYRVFKIIGLILIFIRELILSNIDIVKLVYKRNLNFEPGIFSYPLEVKKDWQITLLANLITLTPGTLSVAISDDNSKIFIHAMHIDNIEESIQSIKETFEKSIMEVSK
ncbi:MAG TPA: Na+/H+ antiporter subunit E [Candidatus Avamphibacillus intestinigallinarum]|nr:Na+/H+ antiporter subunit E [Candidatus Avamphibacillus intestinigallinarum]